MTFSETFCHPMLGIEHDCRISIVVQSTHQRLGQMICKDFAWYAAFFVVYSDVSRHHGGIGSLRMARTTESIGFKTHELLLALVGHPVVFGEKLAQAGLWIVPVTRIQSDVSEASY